jgi:GrpB-like predicted nucleotidyltransferase (UPF0157 family)
MNETQEEKILRVSSEVIEIANYNPNWNRRFQQEKKHLLECLPSNLIVRIEHFGSTSIPNMRAKPIIDILVEVVSLDRTKLKIVPILSEQGYDYFWRPSFGDDTPPYYCCL